MGLCIFLKLYYYRLLAASCVEVRHEGGGEVEKSCVNTLLILFYNDNLSISISVIYSKYICIYSDII